ncbi:MAG: hypothetical protein ACREJ3_19205, partial [Polyangiaceae bacterium]
MTAPSKPSRRGLVHRAGARELLCSCALAALVAGLATSCGSSRAVSEATSAKAPPGEIWLTPAQVAGAKISVEAVAEQDVDDSILTSGTVTLEDTLTGHVFSPVTGRVVKIMAQLGDTVKKGD